MLANRFSKFANYSSVLLRLALAGILIFHGQSKVFGLEQTASFLGNIGFPAPLLFAVIAASIEFFGGILLLLGLLTRLAALLVALEFIVVILLKIFPSLIQVDSYGKIEYDILVLAVALTLLFIGSTKLSLERLIFKKELL